jgi:hypothetical protein
MLFFCSFCDEFCDFCRHFFIGHYSNHFLVMLSGVISDVRMSRPVPLHWNSTYKQFELLFSQFDNFLEGMKNYLIELRCLSSAKPPPPRQTEDMFFLSL